MLAAHPGIADPVLTRPELTPPISQGDVVVMTVAELGVCATVAAAAATVGQLPFVGTPSTQPDVDATEAITYELGP